MTNENKKILIIGLFESDANRNMLVRTANERLAELFCKHDIPIITTSQKFKRLPRLLDIISVIIKRRNEYDIAILPMFGGLSLVLEAIVTRLLKRLNKKIVIIVRGGGIPARMEKKAKQYLPVFNRANVVVSPSGFIKANLKKHGVECMQIENLINTEEYTFNSKQFFRPRLFWMRTFEDVYNPEMAVRVAAILAKKYPDLKMVMAGRDCGTLQMVKDLAARLKVSDKIEFHGYIKNKEKNHFARELDFYLCTNRIDNAPVSLTEMMALGVPVIGVNAGGIPYLVNHGQDAWLVALDDDEAMADAISAMIEQPEIGKRLVQKALEHSKHFGEKPLMKKWSKLLLQLGYHHKSNIPCVA